MTIQRLLSMIPISHKYINSELFTLESLTVSKNFKKT